jgi:selenocysteine-specific elongation factor
MVAGAAGMDIVLLVVAANEGVMPQTIEHLDILRFLSIKKGVIIITKIDIATEEQIKNTKEEILDLVKGTFLEDSPVVFILFYRWQRHKRTEENT